MRDFTDIRIAVAGTGCVTHHIEDVIDPVLNVNANAI